MSSIRGQPGRSCQTSRARHPSSPPAHEETDAPATGFDMPENRPPDVAATGLFGYISSLDPGRVPKWTNGSDCKSDGIAFTGSNPVAPISTSLPPAGISHRRAASGFRPTHHASALFVFWGKGHWARGKGRNGVERGFPPRAPCPIPHALFSRFHGITLPWIGWYTGRDRRSGGRGHRPDSEQHLNEGQPC